MKRILLIPLMALTLSACGTNIDRALQAVTQEIVNPVTQVDIYRVKNVYAASLQLVVEYRRYCWSKPYAVLMADPVARPLCQNRRPIVRKMQDAKNKASSAIRVADNFIRNNPRGTAVSYVRAAWDAVTDFRNTIPN